MGDQAWVSGVVTRLCHGVGGNGQSSCEVAPGNGASDKTLLVVVMQQDGDRSTLNQTQGDQLLQVLKEHRRACAGARDHGWTNRVRHSIHTGDSQPSHQVPCRISLGQSEEAHKAVQDMLERDAISPSSSPWCSPIVLICKKDGTVQFCVDYWKLNAVTRKDAYLLPRFDKTLDTLTGSRWFSTLDLISGYWQVEISEADKMMTAFCTPDGLFQFSVMSFGLCNAPARF